MPQLNYLSNSPWEALTNSAMSVGHSLSGLAGLQLRKQQLEMQQQMNEKKLLQDAMLDAAHASLYRAQSEGEKEKTRSSMEQSQRSGMLGDYVRSMYDTDESQHPMTYNMLRGGAAGTAASIGAGSPATVARTLATLEQNRDPETQRRFVLGGRPEISTPYGLFDARNLSEPAYVPPAILSRGQTIQPREVGSQGLPYPASSSQPTATSIFDAGMNPKSYEHLVENLGPGGIQASNSLRSATLGMLDKLGGQPTQASNGPKPGDVYKGYRFRGGDPAVKENWEKIP